MEYINLVFKPFLWVFDQVLELPLYINGVHFIFVLCAIICSIVLITSFVPVGKNLGGNDFISPYRNSKR